MSYPINDIFEGTGDLLVKHGEILSNKHICDNKRLIYLYYGGYTYLLSYAGGILLEISRIETKEVENNGKN